MVVIWDIAKISPENSERRVSVQLAELKAQSFLKQRLRIQANNFPITLRWSVLKCDI